jgi:hypothetical protein
MTSGRPPGRPSRRPPKNAPASAAEEPQTLEAPPVAAIVRQGRRKHRYPLASASHYAPANGRSRDWLSIRCPYCAGVHLGRLQPGTVPGGPRRTPCGIVWVKVRRTYSPSADVIPGTAA